MSIETWLCIGIIIFYILGLWMGYTIAVKQEIQEKQEFEE